MKCAFFAADPTSVNSLLQEIQEASASVFGDDLTGVYIHGSLAFGCFTWDNSDIDFLTVIRRPATHCQKQMYMEKLLIINDKAPAKGLEMSVVLEEHCRNFIHPTPYELHFSNSHLQRAKDDLSAYCRNMHGSDPDLAAHFTVTRHVGKILCGKPIEEVFGPVPREAYLDSIRMDIENAREDIFENPVYVILNLCRVLAFLREGKILSKKDGGLWGINILPKEHITPVEKALQLYTGKILSPADFSEEKLLSFAEYMLNHIFA